MTQHIQTIAVLGTGCPSCKKLFELTTQATQELGVSIDVEYVTDIQKIIAMGVMQTPALAINGVPVMTGATTDIGKIKACITEGVTKEPHGVSETPSGVSSCPCGGTC